MREIYIDKKFTIRFLDAEGKQYKCTFYSLRDLSRHLTTYRDVVEAVIIWPGANDNILPMLRQHAKHTWAVVDMRVPDF